MTISVKQLSSCALAGVTMLSLQVIAFGQSASSNSAFEFALLGDMPYGPTESGPLCPLLGSTTDRESCLQKYPAAAYQRVITDVNASAVEFTVHVGDIKAGGTRCDDYVYQQNLGYFNTFEQPVIYTPGDNEWTDCHRTNNGSYDPIERLQFLRTTFFPSNQSLGQKKYTLTRQAGYPENARWQVSQTLFVTVHMPGSNNNQGRTPAMNTEYALRNAANIAWVNAAFDAAAADPKVVGIMFFFQANPFERFMEAPNSTSLSGFADFITTIRAKTIAFNKPVVVAHGDTHYFRVDHPLTGTYPACTTGTPAGSALCAPRAVPASPTDRVNNFTRAEVFAQNDVHWIKVGVDPKDPNVFSFMPMRVPGN
jgi:hypothetical protein